jgi:hypothetical protein
VGLPAHEDGHPRQLVGEVHLPLAAEALGQGCHRRADGVAGQTEALEAPLDTAQEQARTGIGVVIGMADVAAVGRHPARQLAHQARTVRADQLQDRGGAGHGADRLQLHA